MNRKTVAAIPVLDKKTGTDLRIAEEMALGRDAAEIELTLPITVVEHIRQRAHRGVDSTGS